MKLKMKMSCLYTQVSAMVDIHTVATTELEVTVIHLEVMDLATEAMAATVLMLK